MKHGFVRNKPLIAMLVKRTVSFFFGICMLLVFLYGVGTAQEFMDITQLILLRLSAVFGLFLGVGSIYGIILSVSLGVHGSNLRYLGDVGGYVLMGALGVVVSVLAIFILVVAEGNGL
jgi:hypothetical protein